jgi:hypothetical protein
MKKVVPWIKAIHGNPLFLYVGKSIKEVRRWLKGHGKGPVLSTVNKRNKR